MIERVIGKLEKERSRSERLKQGNYREEPKLKSGNNPDPIASSSYYIKSFVAAIALAEYSCCLMLNVSSS